MAGREQVRLKPEVIRIPGRSLKDGICGRRFPNPRPDENLPAEVLVCTREPGHAPPCVAHAGDRR